MTTATINTKFFPLTEEIVSYINNLKEGDRFSPKEKELFYYLITRIPYSDKHVEFDIESIFEAVNIKKTTWYTAIKKMLRLGLIETWRNSGKVLVKCLARDFFFKEDPGNTEDSQNLQHGNNSANTETIPQTRKQFRKHGKDSANTENGDLKPSPTKAFTFPKTLNKNKEKKELIGVSENFSREEDLSEDSGIETKTSNKTLASLKDKRLEFFSSAEQKNTVQQPVNKPVISKTYPWHNSNHLSKSELDKYVKSFTQYLKIIYLPNIEFFKGNVNEWTPINWINKKQKEGEISVIYEQWEKHHKWWENRLDNERLLREAQKNGTVGIKEDSTYPKTKFYSPVSADKLKKMRIW